MARIGASHDHPALLRLQHDVRAVAVAGRAGIQHTLHVDVHAVHVDEVEDLADTDVARHFRQLHRDGSERVGVVTRVVQRPDAALPNLHPRIRHRRRHFRIGEFHPGVAGKGDVGMVDVRGHLDVLRHDHLDVRIHVAHHVIVVLGVVQNVHVRDPAHLARARHVGFAREHLASVLRRVDDEGRVPVVPVAHFLAVVVGLRLDFLSVRIRIQGLIERILAGVHGQARRRTRAWRSRYPPCSCPTRYDSRCRTCRCCPVRVSTSAAARPISVIWK